MKGQKLFVDRFVTGIGHRSLLDDQGCLIGCAIRATVKAEMRKLTSYEATAIVHQNNEVRSATCPCPGGVNPACCKHAFAVLSAIEDYSRRELFCAPTEKLQAWHKPKVTKVSPKKYSETMGARGTDSKKFAASTAVNMQALSGLHQTMPVFSVLTGSDTSLLSDEIFYDKTIALPVSSAKSAHGCCYVLPPASSENT
ncbi:hypothetical protein PoB_001406100 [Plakobranchus ocellatus]|uniref:SWIM-type domain-containing protein n=1 Tax=Plakobranchus ocellatus TaxID=259542 RepID=A0AAV3YVR8_9GAST|nr:hypothetical protein PoB_001406100 [Plakobranchus ocellatus]